MFLTECPHELIDGVCWWEEEGGVAGEVLARGGPLGVVRLGAYDVGGGRWTAWDLNL